MTAAPTTVKNVATTKTAVMPEACPLRGIRTRRAPELREDANSREVDPEPLLCQPAKRPVSREAAHPPLDRRLQWAAVLDCNRIGAGDDPAPNRAEPTPLRGDRRPEVSDLADGSVAGACLHAAQERLEVASEQRLQRRTDPSRDRLDAARAALGAELELPQICQRSRALETAGEQHDLVGAGVRRREVDGTPASRGRLQTRDRDVPRLRSGGQQTASVTDLNETRPESEPARERARDVCFEPTREHDLTSPHRAHSERRPRQAQGNDELALALRRGHGCDRLRREQKPGQRSDGGYAAQLELPRTSTGVPYVANW
jgi:hypothetical protein